MPAKALAPVEAFPCIHRFRGHGPLLQGHGPPLGPDGPRRLGRAVYQQGEGPLYIPPPGCATTEGTGRAFVGAGHARESAGSG